MRYLRRGILVAIVLTVVGLPTDYILVRNKIARVATAVSECGGKMGSIPLWPLGSESRVSFRHTLSSQQLDRLAELNSLRGTVGVAFVDCELSEVEIKDALAKLPNCALFRVNSNNSTSAPLLIAQ